LDAVKPGRRSDDEITLYKAMGHAIEDHVATALVLEQASQDGVYETLEL
jgi:ornithine cyclodeaminase/alanine dehydrogenase-like protein (mu-crystallin family)